MKVCGLCIHICSLALFSPSPLWSANFKDTTGTEPFYQNIFVCTFLIPQWPQVASVGCRVKEGGFRRKPLPSSFVCRSVGVSLSLFHQFFVWEGERTRFAYKGGFGFGFTSVIFVAEMNLLPKEAKESRLKGIKGRVGVVVLVD